MSLESQFCWAPLKKVTVPADVELTVWPTARVLAKLKTPPGHPAPQEALLTFSPTLRIDPDEVPADPSGRVPCRMSGEVAVCDAPANESLDLRLSTPGYGAVYRWKRRLAAHGTASLGTLTLVPGGSLSGWVIDERGTEARPDTAVLAVLPAGTVTETGDPTSLIDHANSIRVRVRPDGFFQVEGLAPGRYTLVATGRDVAPTSLGIEIVEGRESVLREPVTLTLPRSVTFIVSPPVAFDGELWHIRLMRIDPYRSQGRALLNRLVPVDGVVDATGLRPGPHVAVISDSAGSQLAAQQFVLDDTTRSVEIEIDAVAVEGALTLGGEPLVATVWFGGRHGAQRVEARSDDQGRYALVLPRAGGWPLEVHAEEPFVRRKLGRVDVPKSRSGRPSRVDIELPATRLFGTVRQRSGEPPAARTILYALPGSATGLLSTSLGNGKGDVDLRGLAPGAIQVWAESATEKSQTVLVDLVENGENEVHLVLLPLEKVKGRVVDNAGLPVPGASVQVIPADDRALSTRRAAADAEGRFETQVTQGTRQALLLVSSPGRTLLLTHIAVSPERDLLVRLPAQGGVLALELPEGTGGYATEKTWVLARDGVPFPVGALDGWAALNPVTGDDATIAAAALAPGSYTACVIDSEDYLSWILGRTQGDCATGILPTFGELRLDLTD